MFVFNYHLLDYIPSQEKETDGVRYNAYKLQVEGNNSIEKHSFEVFSKTTRFNQAYSKHHFLFGSYTHKVEDSIYTSKSNQRFSSAEKSKKCVVKGKSIKDKKIQKVKSFILPKRGTKIARCFRTEKGNTGLRKIRA